MHILNEITSSLTAQLEEFPGAVSLTLECGSFSYRYRPDERCPAASIIKFPILLTALELAEKGEISLEEVVELPQKQVGGSTLVEFFHRSSRLTIQDLLLCMMAISDNFATNMIIDRTGMTAVNDFLSRCGLRETNLQRVMMDFAARQAGRDNYTTPAEMHFLLRQLLQPEMISPQVAEKAFSILDKQLFETGFGHFLPQEFVAHKTGVLSGVFNDIGILSLPDNPPLIFTYFSKDAPAVYRSQLLAAQLGKLVARQLRQTVGTN